MESQTPRGSGARLVALLTAIAEGGAQFVQYGTAAWFLGHAVLLRASHPISRFAARRHLMAVAPQFR